MDELFNIDQPQKPASRQPSKALQPTQANQMNHPAKPLQAANIDQANQTTAPKRQLQGKPHRNASARLNGA
jgi:hypothetical protein